jgi:hypothetical protein
MPKEYPTRPKVECRVDAAGTKSGKAMKWKWTLIIDEEDVDFGEVTGAESNAHEACNRAHLRYLDRLAKASAPTRPKRPRDPAQLAKLMIDIASGDVEDRDPTPEEQRKSVSRVARSKIGGPKGGKARALKLTPEQRADIARLAAQTRWKKSR